MIVYIHTFTREGHLSSLSTHSLYISVCRPDFNGMDGCMEWMAVAEVLNE